MRAGSTLTASLNYDHHECNQKKRRRGDHTGVNTADAGRGRRRHWMKTSAPGAAIKAAPGAQDSGRGG
jgi:hypothetical protein